MTKKEMKLYSVLDGHEIQKGEELTTFRGHQVVVQDWRPPKTSAESGKVFVIYKNSTDGTEFGYYPSVVNAAFRFKITKQ